MALKICHKSEVNRKIRKKEVSMAPDSRPIGMSNLPFYHKLLMDDASNQKRVIIEIASGRNGIQPSKSSQRALGRLEVGNDC